MATRLNDVKFKRIVRPGETIRMDVTLDERTTELLGLDRLTNRGSDEGGPGQEDRPEANRPRASCVTTM